MKNIVFFNIPQFGHVFPTLPLVQRLCKQNANVRYFCSEQFRPFIESVGVEFCPYNDFQLSLVSHGIDDMKKNPDKKMCVDDLIISGIELKNCFNMMTENLMSSNDFSNTDVVLFDSAAIWGKRLAAARLIPSVSSVTVLPVNRRMLLDDPEMTMEYFYWMDMQQVKKDGVDQTVRQLLRLLDRLKIEEIEYHTDFNLIYAPRFLHPMAESFDDTFFFLAPDEFIRFSDTEAFPGLADLSCIRIYISMGTILNNDEKLLETFIQAFSEDRYEVLLSYGGTEVLSEVMLPPNITVCGMVNPLQAMKKADVVVTHGGLNGVKEAIYCGKPMVLLPQVTDSFLNAWQVENLGLGLQILKHELTWQKLRNAVEEVVKSRTILKQVKERQAEYAKELQYSDAVEKLKERGFLA